VVQGAASALADDAARQTYANTLAADAKLAKAQAAVVAGVASKLTTVAKDDFASAIVTAIGTPTAAKATTAVRGNIASGVLRTLDQSQTTLADSVIDKSLTPFSKTLTKAETATYAGTAAAGTTNAISAEIAIKLSTNSAVLATDTVAKTAIAKAVIKALAVTSPTSAQTVAANFINASNNTANYGTDDLKSAFAVDLAKTLPTNGTLTGAAVTGAASTLTDKAITDGSKLLILGGNTIKFAPKAALNIAMGLASVLGASPDYATFAKNLTLGNNLATKASTQAQAAAIAAGVAVTSVNGSGNNPAAAGQSAGDIAVAVSQASATLQAKTLTIAGAVAVAVDVERIADIGNKVGSLLKFTQPVGNKTPKSTSLGALATSLGKAVNTKPFVTWSNRLDEMGELAAEMTRAAISDLGPNASSLQLATAIGSVGSSLIKTLSAAQLINSGTFAIDKADAVGYIAGAIAQTISAVGLEQVGGQPAISASNITALLAAATTNPLYKTLVTAATTKYTSGVFNAFTSVGNLKNGLLLTDRLVQGDLNKYKLQQVGFGDIAKGSGVYEIGSLIDPETPITNVP
jgi:hypothetical protein